MKLKDCKLLVGTPMYGGMCHGDYTTGCLQLSNYLSSQGVQHSFSFLFNESLITRARNFIAHNFLKSDFTHLLFIDSDIKFNAGDVPKMIESDKDIICGIYPMKGINWPNVRNAINNNVPDEELKYHTGSFAVNPLKKDEGKEIVVTVNEPFEISNGATGFMLIKREVFTKLEPHCDYYHNDSIDLHYSGHNPDKKEKIQCLC